MTKKKVILLTVFLTILFFPHCSGIPGDWRQPVVIKEFNLSGFAPYDVYVEGYGPFTWEVYTNPLYEGNAVNSMTVTDSNLLLQLIPAGQNLYLRVKGKYGQWTNYSDKNGKPIPFSFIAMGTERGQGALSPYQINSRDDLIAVSLKNESQFPLPSGITNFEEMSFILTSDIDLTGINWKPLGDATIPFSGTFDGGGYIISGIENFETGNLTGAPKGAGFIGTLGELATVKNLGLKLGSVRCENSLNFLGGLVGAGPMSGNSASISSCFVKGEKILGGEVTGGLAGGGLFSITNCYADISVEGNHSVGGFIGISFNGTTINNCYSLGDVVFSGPPPGGYEGGFTASNLGTGVIQNCITLNKRLTTTTGNGELYFFGRDITTATYYNKYLYCPGGSTFSATGVYSIPINPYTMNQNTPPFNIWNFSEDWKWDDSINRPVLRKVKR